MRTIKKVINILVRILITVITFAALLLLMCDSDSFKVLLITKVISITIFTVEILTAQALDLF